MFLCGNACETEQMFLRACEQMRQYMRQIFWGGVEKENCGGSLIPFFFDLADEQSVKAGAAEILAHKVPIHGIVNNAGTAGAKSLFLMTSIKDIRETFEVNFFGPFF